MLSLRKIQNMVNIFHLTIETTQIINVISCSAAAWTHLLPSGIQE